MRWHKIRALAVMQVYGQSSLLAFQFLAVPAFLATWGSELYGEWLVLMAVPLLFSQLNVGFGSAAAPIMARALHENRSGVASAALAAALAATTAVVILVILIAWLAYICVPLSFAHNWIMSDREIYIVLGCGVIIACASLYKDDVYCTFYAADRQPLGDFIANTLFFAEGAATIVMLLFLHAEPAKLAIVLTGLRLVLICVSFTLSFVKCRSAWRLRGISFLTLKAALEEQRAPALGYFLDPISNIVQNTGVVFLAGMLLGPVAAATMHSHRLLGRVSWQATAAMRSMSTREVLRCYASGDAEAVRRATKLAFSAFFWISTICALGLLALGPAFLRFWLAGKLARDLPLFMALVVSGFCGSVLMGLRSMLQVDNRHAKLAIVEISLSLGALALITAMFWAHMPLYSSGIVLVGLYGLCLAVALRHVHTEIGIPPSAMLSEALTIMPQWVIRRIRRRTVASGKGT